jgi:hypothetical protein
VDILQPTLHKKPLTSSMAMQVTLETHPWTAAFNFEEGVDTGGDASHLTAT